MIGRKSNGRITVDILGLNVFFDDLLEEAKNTDEVMFIAKGVLEAFDDALSDTMEDEEINPSGDEITVDDVFENYRY